MWWGFGGNAKIASHKKTEKHIKIFKILQINLLILLKHPNKKKRKQLILIIQLTDKRKKKSFIIFFIINQKKKKWSFWWIFIFGSGWVFLAFFFFFSHKWRFIFSSGQVYLMIIFFFFIVNSFIIFFLVNQTEAFIIRFVSHTFLTTKQNDASISHIYIKRMRTSSATSWTSSTLTTTVSFPWPSSLPSAAPTLKMARPLSSATRLSSMIRTRTASSPPPSSTLSSTT